MRAVEGGVREVLSASCGLDTLLGKGIAREVMRSRGGWMELRMGRGEGGRVGGGERGGENMLVLSGPVIYCPPLNISSRVI